MAGKTQYRINTSMSIALVVVATISDLLSLIPFVGDAVGPLFWIGVGVYLWKKGMGIFSGRKLAATAISFVAEMIPVVQELPALLVGIIAVIFLIRAEDKIGVSLIKPIKKGVRPPKLSKPPLNSEPGIRQPRNITRFEQSTDEELDMAA